MELVWKNFDVTSKTNVYVRRAIFLGLHNFDDRLHLHIMKRLYFLNSIIYRLSFDIDPTLRRHLLKFISTYNVTEYKDLNVKSFEALLAEPADSNQKIYISLNILSCEYSIFFCIDTL